MRKAFWLFFALLLAASCELYDEDELVVDHTNGIEYDLFDIYEDCQGNKGLVINIYYRHLHGKSTGRICVLSLDEDSAYWGQNNDVFDRVPQQKFNYLVSLAQLQVAVEDGIDTYPAFKWCYQKNKRGAIDVPEIGDWLLPSSYEWYIVMENIDKINNKLSQINLTLLEDFYWCADCYSSNDALVWSPSKLQFYHTDKEKEFKVRAIRYIYYK